MKTLAIKGEESRGEEIRDILESLGGYDVGLSFSTEENIYYVPSGENTIVYDCILDVNKDNFTIFTVDEFKEEFKFKVDDLVYLGESGEIYTITKIKWDYEFGEIVYEVGGEWYRSCSLDLIEKKRMTQVVPKSTRLIDNLDIVEVRGNEVEIVLDSCDSVDIKDGKIRIVRKTKYPKNYKECCEVLGITFDLPDIKNVSDAEFHLHSNFIRLIRYRNAYWKIAGQQMELKEPWKPDWTKPEQFKYCLVNSEGNIKKRVQKTTNTILTFPTEEMRDEFYKNFKDLIDACKELL